MVYQDTVREVSSTSVARIWKLTGPDGKPFDSPEPGSLGGHRRSRIYGRLDCPAAQRAIAKGGYVTHRVFFLNEEHAKAAGYRPCAVCLPMAYANWKASQDGAPESQARSSGKDKRNEERFHRQ